MTTPLAILGAGLGIYEGHEQREATKRAIEQQRINARAAANSRRIAEDEKMSNITSANLAKQAASPFAESSGSFSAIAEGNIEQFSEDRNITKLNLANQMKNLDVEEKASKTSEIFGDINSVFSAASAYYTHKERTKMASPNSASSKGNVAGAKDKPWYDIWD